MTEHRIPGQISSLTEQKDSKKVFRESQRSRFPTLQLTELDRRRFLRLAGAAATGVGLAVLGVLPPMRKAKAGHTTYDIWNLPCNSTVTGYYNNLGACASCGPSDTDPGFCASNNWHRHDTVAVGGGFFVQYDVRENSCNTRNAWKWKKTACCSGRKSRVFRCSDGRRRVDPPDAPPGDWVPTVCPHQLDDGTAC